MKLRNKKTGEIVEWVGCTAKGLRIFLRFEDENGIFKFEVNSLAELNEDWEDYEKPKDKGYWYIDDFRRIQFSSEIMDEIDGRPNNWMIRKQCGNYFETKEEAEKAVEKLKAWKRLKDNGFKLKGWYMPKNIFKIEIDAGFSEDVSLCDVMDDLDKVFGGE